MYAASIGHRGAKVLKLRKGLVVSHAEHVALLDHLQRRWHLKCVSSRSKFRKELSGSNGF